MNLINMLSWWQWLIMLAIPPLIVLLYFLKLRRTPVTVPSTYLWQRAIEDLHVNSIWQRLRKNLLLLLQLLIVAALMFACLRPGFRSEEKLGSRSILMIDNSCSMQATDLGQSRLDKAKEEAFKRVNNMASSDVAMVIAFSDRADIRQGFTSDRRKLREAIRSIRPTNHTTDLNEALRAASGLANPGRTSQIEDLANIEFAEAVPASMYVFSDGGFAPPQLELGNLTAEYIPIGSDTVNNVAILAFTVERNSEKPTQVEAFARLFNFSETESTVTASLTMNGELVDASEVKMEPNEASGVSFQIQNATEGELKLSIEVSDDFEVDNIAYAGLDPPRELEVILVTNGNVPLETALKTSQARTMANVKTIDPSQLKDPEIEQLARTGTIDLFIYDQCAPETMPEANTLFIGAIPPGDRWTESEPKGPLFVINTNKSHPILQYVSMGTIQIVEGRAIEMPQGGTELVRTDTGILMAVAPRDAYQDAVLGMGLKSAQSNMANTDWPIRPSFPVFLLNSLEYLGGAVSSAGAKTIQPGQPAVMSLATRFEKVDIQSPNGAATTIDRSGQAQVIYTATDDLGFYKAKPAGDERVLQLFTVNLFSERESNIQPTPDIVIGSTELVAKPQETEIIRAEFWRWLLALALVILMVEWYLYNRRVAV